MALTNHAVSRALARFGPKAEDVILAKATVAARHVPEDSAALLMARLPRPRNGTWGEASNGDEVWAIVRHGTVVTLMLRRSNQPHRPADFDVAAVHIPRGLIPAVR